MNEKININYSIPEWKSDITLKQWQTFLQLQKEKETIDDDELFQKVIIEIFCGIDQEHLYHLPQQEIDTIIFYLNKVIAQKSEFKQTFKYKGVDYGFIPNFSKDITAGEFINLEDYYNEGDIVRMMSILYRPITKKVGNLYDIEKYTGTHTLFEELPADIYEGCMAFFLTLLKQLAHYSLRYIKEIAEEVKTTHPEVYSLLNGVGTLS